MSETTLALPSLETVAKNTTELLVPVKEAIYAGDRRKAESSLFVLLFSRKAAREWQKSVNSNIRSKVPALLGFVRQISFTTSVPRASLNTNLGWFYLHPEFFIRHVNTFADVLALLFHERDHKILQVLYGAPRPQLVNLTERNFCEDVYINAQVRSLLTSDLVDKGHTPVIDETDRRILLTKNWRKWKPIQVMESNSKALPSAKRKHSKLYRMVTILQRVENGQFEQWPDFIKQWDRYFRSMPPQLTAPPLLSRDQSLLREQLLAAAIKAGLVKTDGTAIDQGEDGSEQDEIYNTLVYDEGMEDAEATKVSAELAAQVEEQTQLDMEALKLQIAESRQKLLEQLGDEPDVDTYSEYGYDVQDYWSFDSAELNVSDIEHAPIKPEEVMQTMLSKLTSQLEQATVDSSASAEWEDDEEPVLEKDNPPEEGLEKNYSHHGYYDRHDRLAGNPAHKSDCGRTITGEKPPEFAGDFQLELEATLGDNEWCKRKFQTPRLHQARMDLLVDDFLGDILSTQSMRKTYRGNTTTPQFDRRSMFTLATGHMPIYYQQEYDTFKQPLVFYVDVSASMNEYYSLILPFVKQLKGYCGTIKQFSNHLVTVKPEEDYLYSTGGTNYEMVGNDIMEHGYTRVIMLTDNTAWMSKQLRASLKGQLEDLFLISTAEPYRREDGAWRELSTSEVNLHEASFEEQSFPLNEEFGNDPAQQHFY